MTIEKESRLGVSSEEALPRSEVVCSSKWIPHQSLAIRPGISFLPFCLLSQAELDRSKKEHQESASRFVGWSEVVWLQKQSDDHMDKTLLW